MKKKSILSIIVSVIGYLVIFVMIAALIIIMRGNIKGEVTFLAGRAVLWVRTQSMEPEIPERSYILIKKAAAEEVSVGDVIVFKSDDPALGGAYNTHRVIEIVGDNDEFVIKGDNNFLPDQYNARAENVVGIYVCNLPPLTVFGRVLQTPMGVIISVTMIFLIMLAIYVPDMVKATKERTEMIEKKRRETLDELVKEEVERLRAADAEKAEKRDAEEESAPQSEDVPPCETSDGAPDTAEPEETEEEKEKEDPDKEQ